MVSPDSSKAHPRWPEGQGRSTLGEELAEPLRCPGLSLVTPQHQKDTRTHGHMGAGQAC